VIKSLRWAFVAFEILSGYILEESSFLLC